MVILDVENTIRKAKTLWNEMLNNLREKKYEEMFSTTALISIFLFTVLNFYFPLAREMILNYYFKEGIFYGISTSLIVLSGALIAGISTSYLFNKFGYEHFILFLILYILFFGVFYYFMLSESAFSFFVYVEMNGVIEGILNAYTLYITIVLSAFLTAQLKEAFGGKLIGTGSGIIAALFSLGCPSCGALLWSIVGIGGLSFLPFNGFELRLLSLLILLWATKKSYESINFKDKKVELKFSI